MKKLLLFGILSMFSFYAFADYTVNFEAEAKGSYAAADLVLNGINWNLDNTLIGTAANDIKNGLKSMRLRHTGNATMISDKTGGIGTVTLQYARYGTDAGVTCILEYSTDGGTSWTPSGSSFSSTAITTLTTATFTINATGNVRIRISSTTGSGSSARINIDDIVMTDFGSPTTSVQFSTTSITLNEDAGTVSSTICVDITNEDATNATTVDVALTGGTATNDGTDFNPVYTTQTLTFAAGSTATQCISFTINDDSDDEGTETAEFTLQNVAGGNSAALGTNTLVTLTINDNDFVAPNVRINEVNATPTGSEFIELYSATGANLDGTVLVLFNGSNSNQSYRAVDLDGITLSAGQYYVIGFSNSNDYCDQNITSGSVQDGADGIGLYIGSDTDFPTNTDATTNNLIDALVYDTSDPDDTDLMMALGVSEQIDENENSASATQSIQRGSWFVAPETPGAANMALPVELISFRAEKQATAVNLFWQTASETHNDRFEIECSQNGQTFHKIGEVKGAHNSHTTLDYQFQHEKPENGVNYYRLKQVDEDGVYEYSNVVSVVWGKDATILVRPNLVQNEMMVELPEPASNDILLEIYDLQGRLVMTNLIKNGDMALQIDMTTLQTGKYILQANENGAISVIRFMKM